MSNLRLSLLTLAAIAQTPLFADVKMASRTEMANDRPPDATLEVKEDATTAGNAVLLVNNGNDEALLYVDANNSVGVSNTNPGATLDIDSGTPEVSGLRLRQLTSAANSSAGATALGVDAEGDVVTAQSPPDVRFVDVTSQDGTFDIGGNNGTPNIISQSGVSSVGFTDVGDAHEITVTFSTAMLSNNYAVTFNFIGAGNESNEDIKAPYYTSKTPTGFTMRIEETHGSAQSYTNLQFWAVHY